MQQTAAVSVYIFGTAWADSVEFSGNYGDFQIFQVFNRIWKKKTHTHKKKFFKFTNKLAISQILKLMNINILKF